MTRHQTEPVHVRRVEFDPDPRLALLRTTQPLTRTTLPNGVRVWLVTSHSLIREVLSDADTFGSNGTGWSDPANGGGPATPPNGPADLHGDITVYDPPEHGRLRKRIAPILSAGRVKALRPVIVRTVGDCLDHMACVSGPVDLIESFAMPVPTLVICELLGVPYADRTGFQQRSRNRFDQTLPPRIRADAVRQSREYMADFVADQRIQPGTGVIGTLIREHGSEMTDRELVGVADILLLGGYETTAHMLGLGTLLLLRNPEHWAAVRNEQNVDGVVEELLRYLTVVQTGTPRVAHRDVMLANQHIRAGERLLCSLPSGNRDSNALGSDLDTFDPSRRSGSHLAFGFGIHYCLGAALARVEMSIAYPALALRFPHLRPAEDGRMIKFRTQSAVYGLDSFPVEW